MKHEQIVIECDARLLNALREGYTDETVEEYLNKKLGQLIDDYIDKEEMRDIMNDIDLEAEDHDEKKLAVICLKSGKDICCFTTKGCKTFLDVAKDFSENMYEDMERFFMESFVNCFGDSEGQLSEDAFSIIAGTCGKDDRIGVVATLDVGRCLMSVRTAQNPNERVFDINLVNTAAERVIKEGHIFYKDELESFDKHLTTLGAELTDTTVQVQDSSPQMN